MKSFVGIKIALVYDGKLICIQRDEKPGLRFSGMWDLPGGGREDQESPIETAQREVFEELHISLSPDDIIYQREYPSMVEKDSIAYFLAAKVTKEQVDNIVFGNEGQSWELLTMSELLNRQDVVPHLTQRLHDFAKSSQLIN